MICQGLGAIQKAIFARCYRACPAIAAARRPRFAAAAAAATAARRPARGADPTTRPPLSRRGPAALGTASMSCPPLWPGSASPRCVSQGSRRVPRAPPARLPALGSDILVASASVPDRPSDAVHAPGAEPRERSRERRRAHPPSTSPSFGAGLFSTAAMNSRSSDEPIDSSVWVHSCGRYAACWNAKMIRSAYCASPRGSSHPSTMARAASSRSPAETGPDRVVPPAAEPARRRASATLTLRESIAAAMLLLSCSIDCRVERVSSPRCCATRSARLLNPATPAASCARLRLSPSAARSALRAECCGAYDDPSTGMCRELRRERASSPSMWAGRCAYVPAARGYPRLFPARCEAQKRTRDGRSCAAAISAASALAHRDLRTALLHLQAVSLARVLRHRQDQDGRYKFLALFMMLC
jgi:hypothetical protein